MPSCDGWEGKVFITKCSTQGTKFSFAGFAEYEMDGRHERFQILQRDYSQNVLFAYRMFMACSELEALPARDYVDVNVRPCKLQIP